MAYWAELKTTKRVHYWYEQVRWDCEDCEEKCEVPLGELYSLCGMDRKDEDVELCSPAPEFPYRGACEHCRHGKFLREGLG